jgi:hypothetical protein
MSRLEELLGSLSTISSILVGFGLAALVQLASGQDTKTDVWLLLTSASWIIGSVLLMGVLLGSEALRRQEISGGRMKPHANEDERLGRCSEWLLGAFALALLCVAAGVILLGFWFSHLHGIAACVAVLLAVLVVYRVCAR